MPDQKSVNIDTKYDLLVAKLLIKDGLCKNKPKKIQQVLTSKSSYTKNILITTKSKFLEKFKKVQFFKPEASRNESKETYLHCAILKTL